MAGRRESRNRQGNEILTALLAPSGAGAKWTVNELYSHSKLSDVLGRMLRINDIPYSASNRLVALPSGLP